MVSFSVAPFAAHDNRALKKAWQGLTVESCPHHYNFHLHTLYSDGKLTPLALMEQAIAIGLKGMAITDHHSVQGFYIAQEYLDNIRVENPDQVLPHLWTGMEITTTLGETEVHILGYGFDPHHFAIKPYLTGNRPLGDLALATPVISALHQAGGLVVLAHPHRYSRPALELIALAVELGIDGIESYYAYGNPKPWKPSLRETDEALRLGLTYGLLNTCGTDTHGNDLLVRI
jgi:predicted metal-dependent phosphoesterase TrpH